jgi:hypothetical protein
MKCIFIINYSGSYVNVLMNYFDFYKLQNSNSINICRREFGFKRYEEGRIDGDSDSGEENSERSKKIGVGMVEIQVWEDGIANWAI